MQSKADTVKCSEYNLGLTLTEGGVRGMEKGPGSSLQAGQDFSEDGQNRIGKIYVSQDRVYVVLQEVGVCCALHICTELWTGKSQAEGNDGALYVICGS